MDVVIVAAMAFAAGLFVGRDWGITTEMKRETRRQREAFEREKSAWSRRSPPPSSVV